MAVLTAELTRPASFAARDDLSPSEVSQRVAVLKRFKELLKAQRDRFRAYLEALDKQKSAIEQGSAEDLIQHVEIEEKIVADIYAIQRVIDPLEDMYRAAQLDAPRGFGKGSDEVPDLKAALDGLKSEAIARSGRNKELLSKRMLELRAEIKSLRSNPYTQRRPAYSGEGTGGKVDLRG
jgi:DNA primase catalytic subunit